MACSSLDWGRKSLSLGARAGAWLSLPSSLPCVNDVIATGARPFDAVVAPRTMRNFFFSKAFILEFQSIRIKGRWKSTAPDGARSPVGQV